MRLARRSPCRAHRGMLLDLAAGRQVGAGMAQADVRTALEHVDRCRRCEADVAATSVIVQALRRYRAELGRAEPAEDGWSRLRSRIVATRRQPSLLFSGVPGLIAALGLCAVLVGPSVLRGAQPTLVDDGSWAAPRTPPAVEFEQVSDRTLVPPTSVLPDAGPVTGPEGPNDMARAVAALQSIPADPLIQGAPDGVHQLAPAGADRR